MSVTWWSVSPFSRLLSLTGDPIWNVPAGTLIITSGTPPGSVTVTSFPSSPLPSESAVATMAKGSPDALWITEAYARSGWSLRNSIQRFASVVPAAPGTLESSTCRNPFAAIESIVRVPTSDPSPRLRFARTAVPASPGFMNTTFVRYPLPAEALSASCPSAPAFSACEAAIPGSHSPAVEPLPQALTLFTLDDTTIGPDDWNRIGP